jgi:flagellar L-ring protein precursor FlgH
MKKTAMLMVGVTGCVLFGCTTRHAKPIADDPYYAPIQPNIDSGFVTPTGSIYKTANSHGLYTDIRAHKVGDIITIKLQEQTSASKSAANDLTKENALSTAPLSLFNKELARLNMNYNDKFELARASDADQSNSLMGDITVNVMKVLNNGNLVIRGEKWITINNGEEFIRITGMIRPQDIETDNTITSLRVANARIQYSGTGAFANNQKPGWLSKFFYSDWWPF